MTQRQVPLSLGGWRCRTWRVSAACPAPRPDLGRGDLTHFAPLAVGQTVTRHSTIKDITPKQGRSGAMVFVVVNYEYSNGNKVCIRKNADHCLSGHHPIPI
ncbi:MaoC family dehydratase N-terminal domain-containing protein [Antarcticimicrobium sp.]|uniref:FAS1-like dehydratase domain-containing protein n=1 Tax=Antarcticimicrobium sp. TaxID=2824147 RepID=UPI0034572BC5